MLQLSFIVLVAVLAISACVSDAGPALDDIKTHGARNIWVPLDNGDFIQKLADNGINSVTTSTWIIQTAKSSAGPDDDILVKESDLPRDKLDMVRAQARECAKRGILYMPYINQLAEGQVNMLAGKHYRHIVNSQGVEGGLSPCPLERKDWFGIQLPQILAFARILAEEKCEGGVMLECETYCAGDIYPGYHTQRQSLCYCDYCWKTFLSKLPSSKRPSKDLKPAERYPWLSARGLLWRYEQSEREELAKLLRELAAEARKVKLDCVFGMYPCSVTWYNDAIAQGLGTKDLPFFIYSATEYFTGYQTRRGHAWGWDNGFSSADQIQHFKKLGASFIYQGGLFIGVYWPQRLGLEMARMLEDGNGFWIYWGGTLLLADDKVKIASVGGSEYDLREKPSLYWPQLKRANEVMSKWNGGVSPSKPGRSQVVWKGVTFTGPDETPTIWDADHPPVSLDGRSPLVDFTRRAFVFDLNSVTSEPKIHTLNHTFRQIGKQNYLFGANVRYSGPNDGARIGLGWSWPGHVEGDGRRIFRYVNELLLPKDGWFWHVRPLEVADHTQPGFTEFQVQANPGKVYLRQLFLAPCSVTTLDSPVLQLGEGESWGRLEWKLVDAERCYYTVDLFDASTDRQLYADLPNGFDLGDVSRIYGLRAIKLKLTCHVPAGDKATLRYLRINTMGANK